MKTLRPYQKQVIEKIKQRWKETNHPLLVNASVGAGKSLIIAEILLLCARVGYRGLCITMNSTLIQQNAHAYNLQDGDAGIYCAGLKSKTTKKSIIFGSPHSVLQGIRDKEEISRQKFNIIIVDECHQIAPHNASSMFMRILNHYGLMAQEEQYSFRILGLSGTPYRDKAISIVGPNELFKEEVASISTSWLIENNYLTKPYFGFTEADSIDFSSCQIDSFGKFNQKDLNKAISKDERLTAEIMRELQAVIKNGRKGCFIFASTKNHCMECARSLPDGEWAIVTGDTSHDDRKKILEDAKNGIIKYLINVNVLTTGIDLPLFDVCAWLRPTESLILFVQGIGRVLRLHPGKSSALILDYAQNLQRHGHIDDQIINEAIQPKENENIEEYPFVCYTCNTKNSVHARRCRGIIDNKRCEYFFEFKDCACGTKNDITARECRSCNAELIDPNAKLTRHKPETYNLKVIKAEYNIAPQGNTSLPIINAKYYCAGAMVYESHFTSSKKSQNIFYAKFLRPHLDNASDYYMHLSNIHRMKKMLEEPALKTPSELVCTKNEHGFYNIVKKVFA